MTALVKDLRHGIRVLLATKSWTAVILVSLALGIGANVALFTAVNGLLLQTLTVPHPDELVRVKWAGENNMVRSSSEYGFTRERTTISYAIFQQLRAANRTLTDLAAFAPRGSFNVVIDGQADLATAFVASGNYFHVLQVNATVGRVFTENDDRLTASPVVVISDAYWRRRFHADPAVITRVVSMNNQAVQVVGVTPPDFLGVQKLSSLPPDVTVPLVFDPAFTNQTILNEPANWWLQTMGRLRPGVTIDQVRGNLDGPFGAAARAGLSAYMAGLTMAQRQLQDESPAGHRSAALVTELWGARHL